MSLACQHYQENAWKGGVCCNCFLPQAEHERHRPRRPTPKQRPSQTPPEIPSPTATSTNGTCSAQFQPNGEQSSLTQSNEGTPANVSQSASSFSQPKPPPRAVKKLSVDIDSAQTKMVSGTASAISPVPKDKPETPKRQKPVLPQKPIGVKPSVPSGKPSPSSTGKPSPPQKPVRKGSVGAGDTATGKPIPVKREKGDGIKVVKSGPELSRLNTEQSEIDDVLCSLDQALKDGENDDDEVFTDKSQTKKHSNSDPTPSSTKAEDKKIYSIDGDYSLPCDVAKADTSSSNESEHYKMPSESTENSLDQEGDVSPRVKKIIKVNGAKTKEPISPAKILQKLSAKGPPKSEAEIRHQKVPIKPFKVGQESKANIARPYKVIEVAPPQEVLPYTVVDISNMPIDNGVERDISLSPPPPKTPPPGEYDKPITSNDATGEKSPKANLFEKEGTKVLTTFKPTSPTPEKTTAAAAEDGVTTLASPAKIPLKPPPRNRNKKPKSPYEPVGLDLPAAEEKVQTDSSTVSAGDGVQDKSESPKKLKEERSNSVKFALSADMINKDEQINGLTKASLDKNEKSKAEFEKKVAQRRSFGRSTAFEAKLSAAIENTLDLAIRKKSKSRKPIPKMTGDNEPDVTWDDDRPIEEVDEEDMDYGDLHQNPKELALLKEKFGKEEKQSKSYFKIGYKKLIPRFGRKASSEAKLKEQEESTEDVSDISPDKDSVSVESVDEKEKDREQHYSLKLFGRKKSKDKEVASESSKQKKVKEGNQDEDASLKASKESLLSAESRESISEEGSKAKDKKVKEKDKDKDKPSLFTRLENIRKSGRKENKRQQERERLKRSMVHYAEGKEIHRDQNKTEDQENDAESSEPVPPGSPEETYNKPWDSAQTRDRLAKVLNRPKSLPPTEHFHLKLFNLDKGKDKKEKNMPPSKEMLFRASSDEVVSAKSSLQQRSGTLTEEAMTEEGENIYDTVGNAAFDFGKRANSLQILPPPLPALPPPDDLSPDHPDKGIYEPVTPTGVEGGDSEGDGDDEEDSFEPIYDSVGMKAHGDVKDFSHTSSDSSHTTSSSANEMKPPALPPANVEDYLEPSKLWDNPSEVPLPFRNVPEEAEESDSYDLVEQHKSGASSDADDLSLAGTSSTAGLVCMASRYGHRPEPLPRPRSSRSLPGGVSPKLSRGPSIKKPKPLDPYVTMIKEGRHKPLKEQPFTSFVDAFCYQATLTLNTLTKIHKLYKENWFLPEDKIPTDLRFQDLDIKGDGPICQIGDYSFYCVRLRDMRCRTEYVLLVTDNPITDDDDVTLQHPNIFNLEPLMKDKIDVSSLPYTLHKYHTSSEQVHLRLLKFSFIETLNQYLTRLRSSSDLVDFEKQMCFVLLQIIDGFGVLQDNKKNFEQKLANIVVVSPLSSQDRTVALMPKIQDNSSEESFTAFEKSEVKDMLVSVLNLAFPGSDWDSVILFTPKYSRGVEKLFDILKTDPGSFLLHSKYLLEFLLFGPNEEDMRVILQMGGKESVYSDDTFQLWFETERVKVVNHLAQQTVAQEQYIRGLSHEYACKICFLCGDAGAQYMTVANMIYG
ncbi:titin [Lingula anatina]|uniref:Titin n=1 Tax=Lingula anatina TaxID=7574 RepID=A0A1S3JXD2_LINAN|nr:titin [Lingula anatina]XP_013415082.1 titin [Lingula anatina]XP_013415083.1 titin [Lingula anatina]XP_013415084.1 titin [Lingula anatina]XP_013415085.1 titin [Lingula anatina]XP_013415086.1 titin [Lingula anatina]XP_013415087.1 titin [Lingula anatina]XP_013415088.1 titin [Lingula anatina]XP_013415089.1 titin [Lingula anatina]XP_023932930.1 titin [Lingula anatina]XP_023932931.1 titin [Lingula anatina]|eukprot:XP_013415081.1 titin [Lingula anatina]